MLYFPRIYPNEYLYSVVLRYDRHTGNNNIERSFKDIFGNNSKTKQNKNKIEYFNNNFQIILGLDFKTFLIEHTNLRLSIPFNKRIVMGSNTDYFFKFIYPLHIKSSALGLKKLPSYISYLKYCEECYNEDVNMYGEGYYHLDHQYEGNYFCKKHSRLLNISMPLNYNQRFPDFEINNKNFTKINIKSDKQYLELAKLSFDIYLLSKNPIFYMDIFEELVTYKDILIRKGYGYKHSKNIKQEKVYLDFIEFFTKESLLLLDIYPNKENSCDWLKKITKNSIYTYKSDLSHIHHLMFIRFFKNVKRDGRYEKIEKKLYKVIN
ncbi:MAG: hypothetical protein FH761_18230 [Firmicutes bacterium]|nr:hypothetical protein [Bacillota bacterium]